TSPITWTGVIETERALHEVTVSVAASSSFDPESARTSYKPEPSPALDAALRTATARRFVAATRFPKASVEKTLEGYRVLIRAFPNDVDSAFEPSVRALIEANSSGKITSEELQWDIVTH